MKINYFPEFWRINFTTESLLNGGGCPFWEVIFIQGLETQVLQKVRIITKTNDLNDVTWMKVYFFFLGKWTRYTPCFTKVNLIRTLAACTTEKSFFNTSRNSRVYRPVSRIKSDLFLDLRIYQCRYDREEDRNFFFWDFYLFEVIFLFICW